MNGIVLGNMVMAILAWLTSGLCGGYIMTKCVKPLSDLVTLSAKSSKWRVLMGRTGRLST